MCLEEQGYVITTTGEYPVLKALPGCRGILSGKEKFEIRIAKEKIPAKKKQDRSDADIDASLLDKLRTLRRELADKANMPAYIIFSNAALSDMCRKCPTTPQEFLAVSGVGNKKLELYGEKFMKVIREHTR